MSGYACNANETEGICLDQKDRPDENKLTIDKDSRINVVVNTPQSDEVTIDLGRVFHNMKEKRRLFAWVLVLCLAVGVCAPLIMYQVKKPMLTVTSVVTLNYDVPTVNGNSLTPVTTLTAPETTRVSSTSRAMTTAAAMRT